ncbi:MAG: glycosyltransferase family 4 protein [Lentisphaerae bacterium]|nr:glycosyltransferase family 4 protein [Lentisphaerota bacterium]
MHLLIVTHTSDRSERAIYGRLATRGHQVDVLCAADAPGLDALRAAGVAVQPIHIRHRLDLTAALAVRRAVRQRAPDVVYAPRNDSLAVTLLGVRGPRPAIVGYRGTIGHISRLDPACWMTYLHPRVARIVCVSEAVRAYLLGFHLPPGRLVTVHKGHDPAWYDALQKPTRASLGLPPDAFLLGFTGRVRPVKGGEVLLQALARVPRELNVHLVMVGDIVDPGVRRLAQGATLRDRVHALGFRQDAAAIAAAFDAFAMPSLEREGLPRAAIEAMCQRVPPIVTRVGGMPELVADGVCGLVVPPRDVDALAMAIMALARDRDYARALGTAARRRIETDFHIDVTTDRMEQLFNGVA